MNCNASNFAKAALSGRSAAGTGAAKPKVLFFRGIIFAYQ
jgi:hypothetical protein